MVTGTERGMSTQYNQVKGPAVLYEDHLAETVFGREWSLVVFDEAQNFRTEGPLLRGVHMLRVRARSVIMATATPLHNGVKAS